MLCKPSKDRNESDKPHILVMYGLKLPYRSRTQDANGLDNRECNQTVHLKTIISEIRKGWDYGV